MELEREWKWNDGNLQGLSGPFQFFREREREGPVQEKAKTVQVEKKKGPAHEK